MSHILRLLPLESADGAMNMAADEALLEHAAAGSAALRFYTWREPTLSLGYFQPASERLGDPRLAALPWLRRSSGGAALVHHHELTYALALPAFWQKRGESWICRFHHVIAKALSHFGIAAEGLVCGEEQKLGPVLCFLHHTPGDLILDGCKIGGSAQRKQRGATMQHGGILLARSEHTPMLPGIAEVTGRAIREADLAVAIQGEFERDTGWRLVPGDWTAAERERIAEIAAMKYRPGEWNERR